MERRADHYDKGMAWVVMLASAASCVSFSSIYCVGIFNLFFLEVFGESKALTAWCPAIMSSLLSLGGPLGGLVAKRFGCRVAVVLGGLLSGTGMVLSSFATSFGFLFFTFGFMTGLGLGIAYTPSVVILGFYFKKYLDIASGISASTAGISVIAFPPLLQYLLQTYGWRGTLLLYSGVFFQLCVFGALMRPPPTDPNIDVADDVDVISNYKTSITSLHYDVVAVENTKVNSGVSSIISNGRFLLYLLSYFLVSAGISSVYMHFQAFVVFSGVDRYDSNYLIMVIGVAGVLGRSSSGFLVYFINVPGLKMYIAYLVMTGLVTIFLPLYGINYVGYMTFAIMFGFFGNAYQAFCGPITVQFVGTENLAMAFGTAMLVGGTSYLLAPPLTGWLYDFSLSYSNSFYLSGVCFLLSALTAICCFKLSCCERMSTKKMEYSTVLTEKEVAV